MAIPNSEHASAYDEVYKNISEEIADLSKKITLETLYNLGLEITNKKVTKKEFFEENPQSKENILKL